jgi:hypothetical protein
MDMMNGSNTAEAEAGATADQGASENGKTRTKSKAKKQRVKREIVRSSIGFPYRDLDAGISVAQMMLGAGGVGLTGEQLAGVMGLQAGSGNFVMKVATAKIFGLVTTQNGRYELTNLGNEILDKDDKRQRQAKRDAFLTVPLYKRAYEEFRNRLLPPRPHGLEQAFIRFGVSAKQKDAARQVFEKSAQQAGFFAAGSDRLIEPIIGGAAATPPPSVTPEDRGNGQAQPNNNNVGQSDVSGLHPFIRGLLDTLPAPKTNWTIEGRAKWLQAAAHNFDLIYMGSGTIEITAKPAPDKPVSDKE